MHFMDGPFELKIERVGYTAVASGLRAGSLTTAPTEIDPRQLLTSAAQCAVSLLAEVDHKGLKSTDVGDLVRIVRGVI